jgi:SpoVK/Ycf46/Vps4 family AAA+-type ATPase
VSADIETICDEVARDVSQRIFDLFETVDANLSKEDLDTTSIIITMDILLKAIHDTPSSLLAVDMNIYEEWEQKI